MGFIVENESESFGSESMQLAAVSMTLRSTEEY